MTLFCTCSCARKKDIIEISYDENDTAEQSSPIQCVSLIHNISGFIIGIDVAKNEFYIEQVVLQTELMTSKINAVMSAQKLDLHIFF